MSKRKFFIDTDTASDDAVAILMALEWDDVEVLGISIVSGNMPIEQGSINARYTVELCKKNIPVYVGAAKPLVKKTEHADWFHGPDGMGGMNYPDPKNTESSDDLIEVLKNLIDENPNEITLVTLGPLTNIANFITKYPDSFLMLKNIVIMGGASNTVGNVTPAAEYNIWCDPEAADAVFQSQHPEITMVGWDNSYKYAMLKEDEMSLLKSLKTKYADFSVDIQKTLIDLTFRTYGFYGFELPDPITMAIALDNKIIEESQQLDVIVDTRDGLTRGQTIVDYFGVENKDKNIRVVTKANKKRFMDLLIKSLK